MGNKNGPEGLRLRAAADSSDSRDYSFQIEEEPQREGEKRKGLNENDTQQHGRANVVGGTRIARNAFTGRRNDPALPKSTTKRCNSHAEARGDNQGCGIDGRAFSAAPPACANDAGANNQDGQKHHQNNCCFSSLFLLMK